MSDAALAQYVGLPGRLQKPSQAALVIQVLIDRANINKDGYAAYLVGCEEEFPANPQWHSDFVEAQRWFAFSAKLNNPAGAYRLGEYYMKGLGGLKPDPGYAEKLETWAKQQSYDPGRDLMNVPQVSTNPSQASSAKSSDDTAFWVGAAALVGLAAILASGSSSSDKQATDKSSSSSNSDGLLKRCTVTEWHMVDGYSVPQQVPKTGFECP